MKRDYFQLLRLYINIKEDERMTTEMRREVIQTDRLKISYLTQGNPEKQPLVLIHGNVSSNLFWTEALETLSKDFWVLAPDLRGYGETEALPIDGSRGVRDWSDDLQSFFQGLKISQPSHIVGWSLGGGVAMQYAIDHAENLKSITLISPISPFGFGGTKDEKGTPCYENFAGSGGGTANPEFADLLKQQNRSEESANSPRNVMNQFYFKPPFRAPKDLEELFVTSMLITRIGEGFYPGGFETCTEWPGVSPKEDGINNAMSPKFLDVSAFKNIPNKIPVLWIRGEADLIVSDQSFLDFGNLGKLGYVEGWPGEEIFPPQPMVSQTRYVLDQYAANGGRYEEFIVENAGHSAHLEVPDVFYSKLNSFYTEI
jgi:pimeloyl-ACP methyl ester carboxylesterase